MKKRKKKKRRRKEKAPNEVKNTKFTPRENQRLWFREEFTNTRGIVIFWAKGIK